MNIFTICLGRDHSIESPTDSQQSQCFAKIEKVEKNLNLQSNLFKIKTTLRLNTDNSNKLNQLVRIRLQET